MNATHTFRWAQTESPPCRFLRDDAEGSTSWNDQLAKKYYDSLYREFAICDLKHYKSGNVRRFAILSQSRNHRSSYARYPQFALRWRTESEVLGGTGETSCANTRCEHHRPPSSPDLSTLELPFAYEEHGEHKEALVKIVLCPKCVRKLMWKRRHDKRDNKEKGERKTGDAEPVLAEESERRRRSRSQSPPRRAR